MATSTMPPPLRLLPIGGPQARPIEIDPRGPAVIGRSLQCEHSLQSEAVSRRHALLSPRGGRWLLSDLESRHGTFVNGQRLAAERPVVVGDGDLVSIGPYSFRLSTGAERPQLTTTSADHRAMATRIETVAPDELARLAQARLDLLMESAGSIHAAADETGLAGAVLHAVLEGSGFEHAALLRPRGGLEEIEVIGHQQRSGAVGGSAAGFSRSLIAEASAGRTVRLTGAAQLPQSMSIAELGISAALCAPIHVGSTIAAYLYLDSRGHRTQVAPDAAAFCQAIARLCGLALANLKRIDLERRHQVLEAEISAARLAQEFIVPAGEGSAGPIRYAMQMRPGFFVAGDLFDVLELGPRRAAVCIGDVTGEGVGAGVIMAAAQAHLNSSLRRSGDPAEAVNHVNRYLAERSSSDRFVSLWVGVFDADTGAVDYVDAGHGHWLYAASGGQPGRLEYEGGIPAGIDGAVVYRADRRTIAPGDRVILYSDGLAEQRSGSGEMFGRDRIAKLAASADSPQELVQRLLTGLEAFAGSATFHDDTTVAAIEVV